MSHELPVRYSDEDLEVFKVLIEGKIAKAEEELTYTQKQIEELNENGFNQQGGDWYDDSSAHTDLELLQRMALRQQRHIQDLRNALLRIQNKTYGICTVTGQLIDKNRLRLVPHATKSMEGKTIANAAKESPVESTADAFGEGTERPAAKPIGDKVRLSINTRVSANGEDWDGSETMESAEGYTAQKFDDDDE